MFLSNTQDSISMVETLRLPVTPNKVCSSCKQYRARITKLEGQLAQYKNMLKRMSKGFDNPASKEKPASSNDDDVLRIPEVIAKNLQIPNYKFCTNLAKCKEGIDFKLDKLPDDQLELMSKEVAKHLRELFIEYFTSDFSLQSATLTEIYIILKSIYKTRFGQATYPLISQSLKSLIEKFSPINPARCDNPENFNFVQDFDKGILLSDVYPCAAFYETLHTIRDQEYKLAFGEGKANPSEITVANLLYGHAQDKFKRFERDLYSLLGRQCHGHAYKVTLKSLPHIMGDLDDFAAKHLHPAYEHLYDILTCRASYTDLRDLENCYNLISRRYQVIRVRNRLDSEHSNLTLSIIYYEIIAEVQLIYGTVGSEYENNLVNQMINCQNIQEFYSMIQSWSSYENISLSDLVHGKVIDSRPLEEPVANFSDHVLEYPVGSDNPDEAGNFFRVIKSKEYGFGVSKSTAWRDNLESIPLLDSLIIDHNKLFIKTLSRAHKISMTASRIESDANDYITISNDDIIEVSGYFTQQHGLTNIQIKTHSRGLISKGDSKTGEFFSISPPAGYHIIGFGGTRSNDGAIRTLYCLISSLKMKRYYPDRSWYEGDWKDGQRQGNGVFEDEFGNRYEGEWKNDQKTGVGLYIESKGEVIYGDFIDDSTNGSVIHLKRNGSMMYNNEIHGRKNGYSSIYHVEYNEEVSYEADMRNGPGMILDGFNVQLGNFLKNRFKFGITHDISNKKEETLTLSNGDTFTGTTRYGSIGLKGKLETKSKSVYEGKFAYSLKSGRGKYFDSFTQETYEGEWKEERKHGNGLLTYRNGDRLTGKWVNDKLIEGTLLNTQGQSLQNEYHDGDVVTGVGSQLVNKNYYYGGFKNKKFENKGTLYFLNGDSFEADWVNGFPHGSGVYLTSSGKKFEGKYNEGNLVSGLGILKRGNTEDELWIGKLEKDKKVVLIHVNNDFKYEGEFNEDLQMHGKGVLTYHHGEKFEGEWRADIMSGPGKLTFVNGESIEGTWQRGALEGQAKYYLKSGDVLEGNYELGRFVSGKSVLYLDRSFSKNVGPNGTEIFYSVHRPRFEGELKKGRIHKGKLFFPDGSWCELDRFGYGLKAKIHYKEGLRYEGDWSWPQGRHGQGRMFDLQNNSFFCEFVDDKPTNGKTVFWDENGYIHIGQVINSSKEGPYRWETPDGKSYEGTFKSNQIWEGFGVQVYHHKYIYEGYYSNGMRHGKASCKVIGTEKVLNGEWKNDRAFSGLGFKRFFVRDFYEGEFKEGKMHGKGVYHFESGMYFEGSWVKDRKEGQGKLYLLDSYVISSKYERGVPVGDVEVKDIAGRVIYSEPNYNKNLYF